MPSGGHLQEYAVGEHCLCSTEEDRPRDHRPKETDNGFAVWAGNKAREIAIDHLQKSWNLGENS